MAEVKEAMQKQSKAFGIQKKADSILYRLVNKNPKGLRDDEKEYPPYIRFPNQDLISWNFGTQEKPEFAERAIRYLPGYDTIFVDEQEKNGKILPENVLNNPNNKFEIIDGIIRVRPAEKTKIMFLDYCNRNIDSPYRTGRTPAIFEKYSEEKITAKKSGQVNKQKEALDLAYNASEEQIAFQAKYLGILLFDDAGGSRSFESIQADYRQSAIDNPDKFLETYKDENLKLKYKIEKALNDGFINLNLIPGRAVFANTKQEICDVPKGTEIESVIDSLFLFAQTRGGLEFFKKISEYGN